MAALDSMVRVHRWMLDEKRRKLVELERFVGRIRDELLALDQQIERERETANRSPYESLAAYAAFHAASNERRQRLAKTVENLQAEVDSAREEVNEAFRELKGYESARERAAQRQRDERARREQLTLDETAIGIYRRRSGPRAG